MMRIDLAVLEREIKTAQELRRVLHACPELSHRESETAKALSAYLSDIPNISIKTHVAGHGIVVDLENGDKTSERVAFRADMDALPVTETTGLPYASQIKGVMHACGHDVHMAIVAGLIRILAQYKDILPFHYRFLFQPAEEDSRMGGAIDMVRGGVLEGVDRIFGGHVWPDLDLGYIGVTPGAIMASCDTLSIRVKGIGSHAAQPHLGADAAVATASTLLSLQTVVSRRLDPLAPSTLTIGHIEAGTRHNIVAENGKLEGTFRTLSREARAQFLSMVGEIAANAAATYGAETETAVIEGYPPLLNNAELSAAAGKILSALPEITVVQCQPKLVSEDFSFYGENIPSLFLWFGTTTDEKRKAHPQQLHNSYFDPGEEVISIGIKTFLALALQKT